MILSTFTKHPDDILDYEIDWASTENGGPWLADGQTIASAVWSVPTGITSVAETNTDTVTLIRLADGVDQSDYECTAIITTDDGQVKVGSILIQVRVTENVSIDATVGGASSNSYATVAEADTYFATRLGASTWDAATVEDKERALITATSQLDQSAFLGMRTSSTQRLAFPRLMIPKLDSYTYWDSEAIPQPIKDATCELAQELLTSSVTSSEVGSLSSVTMGDMLTVNFDNSTAGTLSSRVAALLRGFWLNASGVAIVRS